jgi:type II secretory pathway pseudopilin PulG
MPSGNRRERGFTYLAMLLAVALIGIGLSAAAEVWSQSRQREKEQELLFIGDQFRRAIGLYYERTPGSVRRYPQRLEELLEDDRYLTRQRYLRRIFADPITGEREWGIVVAPEGGIMGVFSRSADRPLKTANFSEADKAFEGASRYSQWRFTYEPASIPLRGAPADPTANVPATKPAAPGNKASPAAPSIAGTAPAARSTAKPGKMP